jgi:hypothetical protein
VRDRPRANTAPPARSPCRGDRFPRSMQEPRPRSRHLHAGHHLANQQAPARLIPGLQSIPGFGVNLFLRHVISGSLALAFVIHTCRAHGATFPRRSPPRPFTAAARGGLRPPPTQRPRRATRTPTPGSSISCTAPHPATRSPTSNLLQRSWHTSGRRPCISCPRRPAARNPARGAGLRLFGVTCGRRSVGPANPGCSHRFFSWLASEVVARALRHRPSLTPGRLIVVAACRSASAGSDLTSESTHPEGSTS